MQPEDKHVLRVVIPEPIPSTNKGEAAILEGIRESLNVWGRYELTVYSPSAWIDDDRRNANGNYQVVDGVDLFDLANLFSDHPKPRGRLHFFRTWGLLLLFSLVFRLSKSLARRIFNDPLLKAMGDADVIVAGHDGLFGPDHFYIALASKILKKPLAMFGGGHDLRARERLKVRIYLRFMVNNALICTVRDPWAKSILATNGVPCDKVYVFPDPAVLLRPCDASRVREILARENVPSNGVPLYGLIPVEGGIVSRTSFSGEPDRARKHALRVGLWKEILIHLLETTNAHFIFFPHCIGPVAHNDDRQMNRDVFNAIRRDRHRLSVIDGEYSASELKGIANHCDFVLGERLHGLIGCVSVGTPCIALTTKEDSRMHHMMEGFFGRRAYDLNDPDLSALKSMLLDEWNHRHATSVVMKRKAEELHAAAVEAAELLKQRIVGGIHKNVLRPRQGVYPASTSAKR